MGTGLHSIGESQEDAASLAFSGDSNVTAASCPTGSSFDQKPKPKHVPKNTPILGLYRTYLLRSMFSLTIYLLLASNTNKIEIGNKKIIFSVTLIELGDPYNVIYIP
jgi:hypothetical protein